MEIAILLPLQVICWWAFFEKLAREARINALVRERWPAIWREAQAIPWWRRSIVRHALLGPLAIAIWPGIPRSYRVPWDPEIRRLHEGRVLLDAIVGFFGALGLASHVLAPW